MSELDVEIREIIADRHQLPAGSASFLSGATLEEVERSAERLRELVGERRESEPTPASVDAPGAPTFTDLVAASRARKQALGRMLAGQAAREQQPRDEMGRFAGQARDLGRGARTPVPPSPPSHEQTLVDVFRSGAANAGRRLFDR